jgi:hypothetical protein
MDSRLIELQAEGLTQTKIAEKMSQEFGILLTRDAVKNRLARVPRSESEIKPVCGGYRVRVTRGRYTHTVGTYPTQGEAEAARDKFIEELNKPKVETAEYSVQGVTAIEMPDFESAFQRATEAFRQKSLRALRKAGQRIDINTPRACFVFVADQHIGSPGTDIERVFEEAKLIASMRNTYPVTLGDIAENAIIQKLLHLNMNNPISITDGWIMFEKYMEILGPKAIVGGNHDNDWTQNTTGMDYPRHMAARYAPNALYDTDDCRLVISVQGVEFPTRIRHKWKGTSIYNPTHGPERGQKWDQDFVLGVSAHIHTCGVARQFNAGGRHGLAVLCGSYKTLDSYASEQGFPKPNGSTAVAVLFDAESETMTGFESLQLAAEFMEKVS